MTVIEKKCKIQNHLGLHLRAANKVVRVAARFHADIWLLKDGMEVDAKSIMGITLLAAAFGSDITVRARGIDAREAVEALVSLIDSKFDEEA